MITFNNNGTTEVLNMFNALNFLRIFKILKNKGYNIPKTLEENVTIIDEYIYPYEGVCDTILSIIFDRVDINSIDSSDEEEQDKHGYTICDGSDSLDDIEYSQYTLNNKEINEYLSYVKQKILSIFNVNELKYINYYDFIDNDFISILDEALQSCYNDYCYIHELFVSLQFKLILLVSDNDYINKCPYFFDNIFRLIDRATILNRLRKEGKYNGINVDIIHNVKQHIGSEKK